MTYYPSEKLGLKWNGKEKVLVPNRSGLIWQPFVEWWEIFDLKGDGLLIGETYSDHGQEMKSFFSGITKGEGKIVLSSLSDSDVNWDITQPYEGYYSPFEFDWILCQAVLEHVIDPVQATKNLVAVLKVNGFLYLHSHGPEFQEHRHPIDCWRFLRDGVIALADQSGARIVDMLYTSSHWFLLLQKVE